MAYCTLRALSWIILFRLVFSTVYVLNNDPFGAIVASFEDAVSQFGPELFHLDGFLVIASPLRACTSVQSRPEIFSFSSNASATPQRLSALTIPFIAIIERGDCNFDLKVWNVQQAGFSGAIVYDTVDEKIFPMGGRDCTCNFLSLTSSLAFILDVEKIEIPAVMVDRISGYRLKTYSLTESKRRYLGSMVSFYNLPLKYVLLSLLVLVGASLLVLIGCFAAHLCNLWRRAHRGRLSQRHLRQLVTKRFVRDQDPFETCPICLEDYKERDKLRLLPCHHAFHTECIDPWLLRNRRRCPVCNQTVEILGAPALTSEEVPAVTNQASRSLFLRGPFGRLRQLIMYNRLERDLVNRTEETAPLLTDSDHEPSNFSDACIDGSRSIHDTTSVSIVIDHQNNDDSPLLSAAQEDVHSISAGVVPCDGPSSSGISTSQVSVAEGISHMVPASKLSEALEKERKNDTVSQLDHLMDDGDERLLTDVAPHALVFK
ncbi:E3 ubiquitin-protein ligase RNF13 [Paragonimus westermani]|uniref:E3 ubiquitin-protein ligase RNF13 n=1 Tax=Paragonimus westermani TaxID=34504 RepID=A0A5J4NYZ5_9TREM|nr:E3 ubiquitin-protein ligase RNF13 [Paragonimus westermani]